MRRDADANQPMAPATMKTLAREWKDFARFIFSCSRSVNPDSFVLISRASLQALMVSELLDLRLVENWLTTYSLKSHEKETSSSSPPAI
jgi:hypothetical protein